MRVIEREGKAVIAPLVSLGFVNRKRRHILYGDQQEVVGDIVYRLPKHDIPLRSLVYLSLGSVPTACLQLRMRIP